jgi:GTP-binding protein YchF
MKIGLIGFPKSGKTTIYNALTGNTGATDKYIQAHHEAHIGVVQVLDERVTRLSEIYKPKKTIYAHLEYYDFPALFAEHNEDLNANVLLSEIKTMEGFALVLRSFNDSELDELHGKADPLKDIQRFEDEMILQDMVIAEKRLEKIELSYKRGIKTPALQLEEKILHHLIKGLQDGLPIRRIELAPEEEKAVRGFQFMSQKPLLALLNCSEDNFQAVDATLAQLKEKGYLAEAIAGKFEEELSGMEPEDAAAFMEDMGISESVRDRLTHLCYELMGYLSFFTVGEDEVRAWTIEKGDNAVTAAGKIHSDLARGFIRAECFQYTDLIAHGSEKALKEKGLFKLEGKEYPVKDGDILSIRFNV